MCCAAHRDAHNPNCPHLVAHRSAERDAYPCAHIFAYRWRRVYSRRVLEEGIRLELPQRWMLHRERRSPSVRGQVLRQLQVQPVQLLPQGSRLHIWAQPVLHAAVQGIWRPDADQEVEGLGHLRASHRCSSKTLSAERHGLQRRKLQR